MGPTAEPAHFEKLFCVALTDWLALGQHKEPIGGFYPSRVQSGVMLNHPQLTAASAILREAPQGSAATLEIGAGYGQLSMWLVTQGRPCIAVEQQAARVAGMHFIATQVLSSQERSRLQIHSGPYPQTAPEARTYDSIVTGNVIGGWWPTWLATREEKLRACFATPRRRLTVLDVERFGEHLPSADEQAAFATSVAKLGFRAQHETGSVWSFHPTEL